MAGVWQHTITDDEGNVLPGASVEVRYQISNLLASLYSDYNLTTPIGNPTVADGDGFVRFFAGNGLYHITATSGTFTREWIYTPIGLTVDADFSNRLDAVEAGVADNTSEIIDNLEDIDRLGETTLENMMRLFRIGRPLDTFDTFELATRTITLPDSGITLQTYFDTLTTTNEQLAQVIDLLGVVNGDQSAFILDVDTVNLSGSPQISLADRFELIESNVGANTAAIVSEASTRTTADTALASSITALTSTVGTNTAAIATEASTRASADSALSSSLTTLSSTVGGHTSSITTLSSTTATLSGDVSTLYAKYGVTLNVGGYITGFVQNNNGSTGTFDILTDKFRVVNPAGGGSSPTQVFTIESGNVLLQNLYLHQLVVGDEGYIRRGKTTAADTTSGFWLGWDGASGYDFHIGDLNNYLRWDDSANSLTIAGSLYGSFTMPSGQHVTITPTYTGWSTNPTKSLLNFAVGSVAYILVGNSGTTGTSNAADFQIAGIPLYNPLATTTTLPFVASTGGSSQLCIATISTTGVMNVSRVDGVAIGTSGTKGFVSTSVIAYPLPAYQWA